MTISTAQIISMFVGVLLPIIVALVSKRVTRASVKAVLLLGLSAVSGFLTEFLQNAAFDWQQAAFAWIITFVIGVAMQFGLWKPTGVSDAALAVPLTGKDKTNAGRIE